MSEIAKRLTLTDWGAPDYLDGARMQFMVTDESTPMGWCIAYFGRREDAEKLIEADRLAAENAELTTERDAALEWAERYEQVEAERDRLREAVLRWHRAEMGEADPDEVMAATAALADTARALSKGER